MAVSAVHHLNLACALKTSTAQTGLVAHKTEVCGCDTRLFQADLLIVLFSEVEAGQVLGECDNANLTSLRAAKRIRSPAHTRVTVACFLIISP